MIEIDKNLNKNSPEIIIIDLGSQYTQLIARVLREIGFRSAVLTQERAKQWLLINNPKAIILSGGHASVNDANSPKVPQEVWEKEVPILGICYGMQYIVKYFGGKVTSKQGNAEYGPASIEIVKNELFEGLDKKQNVWASHGDTVEVLPDDFEVIASTDVYKNSAIANFSKKIFAVQFHPEVINTENGVVMLKNFVENIANCQKNWKPQNIIEEIREEIRNKYSNKKTIIGFSGGVDSSALTAVLAPVLWKNLLAICIDAGQFRDGEIDEIKETIKSLNIEFKLIDKKEELESLLNGVTNSQKKREVFRKIYREEFDKAASEFGADIIAQGSLATDFIESGAIGGGEVIKTHHNIDLGLEAIEIHPFRHLFKYEVRALANEVGLPKKIAQREPFPGPGLILRVVGDSVTSERLDIVRFADKKTRDILEKHNLLNKDMISQLVVYMLAGSLVVGVKGDKRVYDAPIVIRGLKTIDFMTGEGVQFPSDVRSEITLELTKHKHISRVLFDETPKPPATTEPE